MKSMNSVKDSKVKKDEEEIVAELRESFRKMGPVRPVITTRFGIAGGETRKKANPAWPEQEVSVASYYDHLRVKVADNVHARKSPAWWTGLLEEAAEELAKGGAQPGGITRRLKKDFPLSERTIMAYLPQKFKSPAKARAGSLGGSAAAAAANATSNDRTALTTAIEMDSEVDEGGIVNDERESHGGPFPEKTASQTDDEKEGSTTIDNKTIEKEVTAKLDSLRPIQYRFTAEEHFDLATRLSLGKMVYDRLLEHRDVFRVKEKGPDGKEVVKRDIWTFEFYKDNQLAHTEENVKKIVRQYADALDYLIDGREGAEKLLQKDIELGKKDQEMKFQLLTAEVLRRKITELEWDVGYWQRYGRLAVSMMPPEIGGEFWRKMEIITQLEMNAKGIEAFNAQMAKQLVASEKPALEEKEPKEGPKEAPKKETTTGEPKDGTGNE